MPSPTNDALCRTATALALCLTLLYGCSSTSDNALPNAAAELGAAPSWKEASGAQPSGDWVASFQSETLSKIVSEAEERNFGLESAYQQTRAAQAAARIANAGRLPSLGAGLRASDSQSMVSFAPPIAAESEAYSLNLSARWELDLWGRLSKEHASSVAQYRASEYDLQSFRLSLSSQVAKAWFNLIEAQSQFQLANASADAFDTQLESLAKRYERGLASAFELRLTRAQASASRANAVRRRSQVDANVRFLETLLGRYPSSELSSPNVLPEVPPVPHAGLPSELLERRPDVLAQQQRLLAALAVEKAAMKNWLPSLTLTASNGTLSNDFADLLDDNFNVWSLAGDIGVALFQGGRLKGQRDQLQASQLAQLARYQETVLAAFREVETALRAESDLQALEEQTKVSVSESQLAEKQAWQLYERGLVDITAVLDSERRSFDAQSQLLSIRNQRLQNRISLHLALGGDM